MKGKAFMGSRSGKGGIIAAIIAILGVLLLSGAIGPSEGMIASLFHLAGIACVVVGVAVFAIVVGVLIAAFASKRDNSKGDAKKEVNQLILEKRQQLAKFKSTVATAKFEHRKLMQKSDDLDRQIIYCNDEAKRCVTNGDDIGAKSAITKRQQYEKSKAAVTLQLEGYQNAISEMENLTEKLESDIISLEQRRDTVFVNQTINDGAAEAALKEYKEKAQYEADYAQALRELESGTYSKYESAPAPSFTESSVDEELEKLKKPSGMSN